MFINTVYAAWEREYNNKVTSQKKILVHLDILEQLLQITRTVNVLSSLWLQQTIIFTLALIFYH